MRRTRAACGPARLGPDRGFTLLETLVALLVVSAGLLGIAALHAQALSLGRAAQFRSHAADLAADMAERLRANPQGRDGYLSTGALGAGGEEPPCGSESGGQQPAACSPSQMAAADILSWRRQTGRLLPNGEARVHPATAEPLSGYVIELLWEETGAGAVTHRIKIRLPEE